jgi:hypothetical protein
MRFIFLVHVDPSKFLGMTEADHEALDAENYADDQALLKSGRLIAAGPLAEPETATVIRNVNGQISMTDGPYVETKEHLGGFVLVEVRDRAEALELARTSAMARYGSIEVREHWALEPPFAAPSGA